MRPRLNNNPIPEDGRTRANVRTKENAKSFKLFGRQKGTQQNEVDKMTLEMLHSSTFSLPPPPDKSCFSSSSSELLKSKKDTRKVSFDKLYIREHRRILGDNPSVSCGPALAIDWYNEEEDEDLTFYDHFCVVDDLLKCQEIIISVDDFENTRRPRRPRPPLVSAAKREKLLRDFGVSKAQIILAEKAAAHEAEAAKKAEAKKVLGGMMNLLHKSANVSAVEKELDDLLKRVSIAAEHNKRAIARHGNNVKTSFIPIKQATRQVYITLDDNHNLVEVRKEKVPVSDETNSTVSNSSSGENML